MPTRRHDQAPSSPPLPPPTSPRRPPCEAPVDLFFAIGTTDDVRATGALRKTLADDVVGD
ncbi:MAG: hypothetical protein AB7G37_15735 [Solirubrobacteraceae bacterium]